MELIASSYASEAEVVSDVRNEDGDIIVHPVNTNTHNTQNNNNNDQNTDRTISTLKSKMRVNLAPTVIDEVRVPSVVDHKKREIFTNPLASELWRPIQGAEAPWTTNAIVPGQRNTLTGFVEDAAINDYSFDQQHYQFAKTGIAQDPGNNMIAIVRKDKKRKKPSEEVVIEPIIVPMDVIIEEGSPDIPPEEINEHPSKKPKYDPYEAQFTLHIDAAPDYLGRTWFDHPSHLKQEDHKCYVPKKKIHTWAGHRKGVSAIRFFPKYGHLLLSASMDKTIKIWEVYGKRRCVQTYYAHTEGVKDIDFTRDGTRFLSCSFDRHARVFNTETGQCIGSYSNKKVPYSCKFYPEDENIFLVGQQDKKVIQWDVRTGGIVQEYDRHLGAINTITFIDENRRFVTTSDDKSIRVWEFGIGVEIKYIAEPHMHSIPSVTRSSDDKWLLCQSLDNKILVYSTRDKFRLNRKKTFRGHLTAGYACQAADSPDGRWIVSGTSDGGLWFWDWKTTKILKRIRAHEQVTIGCQWHPIEPSKVASCSWDGTIKFWD